MCVCVCVSAPACQCKKERRGYREREDSVFYALLRLAAKGLDSSSSSSSFLSYLDLLTRRLFLSPFSLCYSATVYSVRLLHIRDRSGRRIGRDFLSDQKKKKKKNRRHIRAKPKEEKKKKPKSRKKRRK
jgi:hypothetical protein